ncbi:MAG: aspartate aminotransferase family protein [Myxococcales bacterium]|nr:aspartate aminotransferase family protein [Myxococcales bacterium]
MPLPERGDDRHGRRNLNPVDRFDAYTRHVNPALGQFLKLSGRDLRLVRAEGCTVEDASGRRFDDWIAGFGSQNLGHNPQVIKDAIRRHLDDDAPSLFVENLNPFAGELAVRLTAAAGPSFEVCFFCNSGAEAVEAALKTALAATGRPRIAYAAGGYHGSTLGALACMAEGIYRAPFDAVLAPFVAVPWDDLAALERALAPGDIAGFLVEPIQIEAGVRVASHDYLRAARALCQRAGALLIYDEVQTGMGRTGELFAFHRNPPRPSAGAQGTGAPPDILVLAKALGGGMVPIGAAVFGEGLWQRAFGSHLRSEIHNSTFGGNALACRAALAALSALSDPAFLSSVRARGAALFAQLAEATSGSPLVLRLTSSGLLGGLQIRDPPHPWFDWKNLGLDDLAGHPTGGALLMQRLFRHGILAQVCGHDWSVLRIEPPLTVDEATCARFVAAVAEALTWLAEMS